MDPSQSLVDALLAEVERCELRSLRWGYADGSLSETDIDALAQVIADSAEVTTDPTELVEWMVERCLLFESSGSGGYRYRSRFAEGVRLLTRLKQLMPHRPWMAAPDLVSDYRIDARPRRAPRRDIVVDEVIHELARIPGWDVESQYIAEAFVDNRLLSGFQVRAAQAVLRRAQQDVGTVLTSGTGSGKTLAFYLPAALELSPLLRPRDFWTKVVAVFPRIELLKDQLSQAHGLLAPLGPVLRRQGRRPFRLGTFFSATPRIPSPEVVEGAGWSRHGQGYRCPFLLCRNCGGALIWFDVHLTRGHETLTCVDGCGAQVGEDEIILTRERARKEPPDLVFTTAETLNQRLSDTTSRHVLGITRDRTRRARLMLLDEIHTYGGTSGAQTALVLRRWRHAMGLSGSVHYVGLSATLEDAARFFSELTGLRSSSVTEVSPREDELSSESMEYQLVLRGDPASRTQLLSTTIQVSFLLARLLDPQGVASPSQGRYGSRVFAFTDDLDATNRLFDFLRDAEAWDLFGNPDGARTPLAALRGSSQPDRHLRNLAGQDWGQLERLGRPLTQRLVVGRTSSQDRGVDWDSDVIVATAALEVGFNDPTVGAIVQHKSPHQLSAFIQRRGRAGRNPIMRPWMVTVLSDYGRDRLTYQSYDRLFDPILKPSTLPVRNRYILRMQAAFATLDWLAVSNPDLPGWWWQPLKGPVDRDGLWRSQQLRASAVLAELLEGPGPRRQALSDHVRRALRLESEEADEILWGSPRSLLLEVLPTLARRLETTWELHPALRAPGPTDLVAPGPPHPLPDFLPGNLFSDLNLPEVSIVLPPATRRHTERIESMPIAQAIGRLAPGRVTRRFASERGRLNHWIPVPLCDGEHLLTIDDYAERYELVTHVPVEFDGVVLQVPCFRPWTMRLRLAPDRQVMSTSNAWQQWRTQILPQGEPIILSTEHDPRWGAIIRGIDFYMHAFHAPVTVRRFALEANATVKAPPPTRQEFNVVTRYRTTDGTQAAVGFEQEVDGILIRLGLPDGGELADRAATARSLPAWKAAYFRDRLLDDPELSAVCNWFQRDRLHHLMLAALIETAVSCRNDLAAALGVLVLQGLGAGLRDVAIRIFAMELDTVTEDDEETPTESEDSAHGGHLDQRWDELLTNQVVIERLEQLAPELWDASLEGWGVWLRTRTHETLGEALLSAAYDAAPSHMAEGSLLLDFGRGLPDHDSNLDVEVWLTESALGGSGAVEALAREATQDPRRLIRALQAAVVPSDVELTALGLEEFVDMIGQDTVVANAVEEVRRRTGHEERIVALNSLYSLLAERGLAVDQGFKIAVNHRILREGTGASTDALLRDLVGEWRTWEAHFGVAIDLRTFALVAASHDDFGPRIRDLVAANRPTQVSAVEAAGVLSGLLWPRTGEVRGRTFQSYGPFRTRGHTDPSFVRELLLPDGPNPVAYGVEDWHDAFAESLAATGSVRVWADAEHESEFHAEIYRLLADPVDVDYLQLYPVITEVARNPGTTVTFVLREMF